MSRAGTLNLSLEVVISDNGEVQVTKVISSNFTDNAKVEGEPIEESIKLNPSTVRYGYLKFPIDSRTAQALIPGTKIKVVYKDKVFSANVHTQPGRLNGLTALFRSSDEFQEDYRCVTVYDPEDMVLTITKIHPPYKKAQVLDIMLERGMVEEHKILSEYVASNGKDYGWNALAYKIAPDLAKELYIYGI